MNGRGHYFAGLGGERLMSERCCHCGVLFYMPQWLQDLRRGDKEWFYCPNGHRQRYVESEADTLRRERDRLAQQIAQRDDALLSERRLRESAERQASTLKGSITKLRKRLAGGACPCCNRTFANLQRHMETKHAGFVAEPILAEGASA